MQKAKRVNQVLVLALLALLWTFSAEGARAEALVLIQGYLDKGGSWRDSGVSAALTQGGWRDGGRLISHNGRIHSSRPRATAARQFYTLDLRSDAPLMYQLAQLKGYIDYIRTAHPGESLTLVGHSAGGVLGRLYMVQNPDSGVSALISIASPHLGTDVAELGLMAGRSPLNLFSRLLGGNTLDRSQGLYFDLVRERPGSLLFWLNRQQHPRAVYISIVRSEDLSWIGDLIVPESSQDMNRVYALRGASWTIPTSGNHGLDEEDGRLLVNILQRMRGS